MRDIDELDDYLDDFDNKIQLLLKRMLEEGNKLVPEMKTNSYLEFGEYQQKKIAELFTEAVDKFYSSYTPFFYERTWSLYNALDMQPDELGMVDWKSDDKLFSSDYVSEFERGGGSEGLFEHVFMQGFHGGATGEDHHGMSVEVPSYRRPFPGLSPNTDKYGDYGGYFYWGRKAVKTDSPHDLMMLNIMNAKPEIYDEFRRVVHKHAAVLVNQWQERINELVYEMFG